MLVQPWLATHPCMQTATVAHNILPGATLLAMSCNAPVPECFLRGVCFAEYVADKTGYELIDMAVGSSTTNKTTSFHGVGDFYPSSLLSNKRGARNVTLPTFNEAVTS